MKEKFVYVYHMDASYARDYNCFSTAFTCSRKKQKQFCHKYVYEGTKLFEKIQSNGSEVMGCIRVLRHVLKNKGKIEKALIHYDNEVIVRLAEGKEKPKNHVYQEFCMLHDKLKHLIEFKKTTNNDPRHKSMDRAAYNILKKHLKVSKLS